MIIVLTKIIFAAAAVSFIAFAAPKRANLAARSCTTLLPKSNFINLAISFVEQGGVSLEGVSLTYDC
jgi:hypothetical protein